MKTLQRISIVLVIALFASISALADNHVKKTLVFATDTVVNGTVLKAGTYQVNFDQKTGAVEVSRDGKVRATATGHIEHQDTKAPDTALLAVHNGANLEMIGVEIGGSTDRIILNNNGASSSQ